MTNNGEAKTSDLIDLSILRQLDVLQEEGQPDVIVEIIDLFLSTTPDRIEAILKSFEAGNAEACGKEAHALKSGVQALGAVQLGEICQEMENLGKMGKLHEIKDLLPKLQLCYQNSRQALLEVKANQLCKPTS